MLLFTCLYSRAIHMEILDSMDTAAFLNALARFEAVRGKCVYLRSDQGSNFMGARNDDSDDQPIIDPAVRKAVQEHWQQQGRTWEVNPPLASHFGGVWERAIGQVRQILQAYLLPKDDLVLQLDEFHTLLLSAAKIVNSTPLWETL